jgi:hypothetical protein
MRLRYSGAIQGDETMLKMWVTVLGAVLLAGSAQAAPDLSAAYAKPVWMQSAVMVRTELAQDDLDKPEGETSGERDPFSPAPIGQATSSRTPLQGEPASPQEMARPRDRYERGRALHRAGNITTLVGGIAVLPLTLGFVASAWNGNNGAASLLGVGMVASVGAYYTGGILSSLGALNATHAVNAAFGTQVRTDFAIGGLVSSTAGILLTPIVLGGFAPIVGIICGVVQLQQVDRALAELGVSEFHISPTPQGFAMSMRF